MTFHVFIIDWQPEILLEHFLCPSCSYTTEKCAMATEAAAGAECHTHSPFATHAASGGKTAKCPKRVCAAMPAALPFRVLMGVVVIWP
jgi:hypothetical protein